MKNTTLLCTLSTALILSGVTSTLLAGPMSAPVTAYQKEVLPPAPMQEDDASEMVMTFETDYTWESNFESGDYNGEEGPSVWASKYSYLRRIPLQADDWYFRLGLDYSYWDIDGSSAPLPETLQSVALPLGVEWKEGKFFKFLFQTSPGFYFSEEIDWDDFDIPTVALYGFDLFDDFTLYVGAVGGLFTKYGVLPVGGFVWEPQRWLIVRATFPEAGVYFSPDKDLTFFAGGEFLTGSFRVDRDDRYPPALQEALIDYTEIRAGGHVTWRFTDWGSITLGGGYAFYRDWEYERADVEFEQEGAPYAKAELTLSF